MPENLEELHEALEPFRQIVDKCEAIKPPANQSLRLLMSSVSPTWFDLLRLVAVGEKILIDGGHSIAG